MNGPGHRIISLSLPLLVLFACATGQEIPESQAVAPLEEADAGNATGSIKIDASSSSTTTSATEDAGAAKDSSTASDASTQADTAPPPPPPPTTPVCDPSDNSYGLLVLAMVIAGSPPPACTAGACGSGECCYNGSYCLPQ